MSKERYFMVRLPAKVIVALIFDLGERLPKDPKEDEKLGYSPEYRIAYEELKKQTGLKGDMHCARSI